MTSVVKNSEFFAVAGFAVESAVADGSGLLGMRAQRLQANGGSGQRVGAGAPVGARRSGGTRGDHTRESGSVAFARLMSRPNPNHAPRGYGRPPQLESDSGATASFRVTIARQGTVRPAPNGTTSDHRVRLARSIAACLRADRSKAWADGSTPRCDGFARIVSDRDAAGATTRKTLIWAGVRPAKLSLSE